MRNNPSTRKKITDIIINQIINSWYRKGFKSKIPLGNIRKDIIKMFDKDNREELMKKIKKILE